MWLTKKTKGPAHQWVEVTAVPRGHRLLWPVKLFGRVLDQEQHSLCYGDLAEKKDRENSGELSDYLFVSWSCGIANATFSHSATPPRACLTMLSEESICTDTAVEYTGTYGREEVNPC